MLEMCELTDMELDAVCGGTLNIGSPNIVTQTNTVSQVGVAIGGSSLFGLLSGNAVVSQRADQSNWSSIVS
jgi:hypothetical protein